MPFVSDDTLISVLKSGDLNAGDQELVGNQSNSPEIDNPRTWVASSAVEVTLDKVQHGKMLRCSALHESYPTKSQNIDVRLDVTCE
jgi:hypothetical protein